MDVVIPNNSSAKGLFQNILPSFPTTIKIKMSNTETIEPKKSIIAPILSNNDEEADSGVNTACLFDDDDDDDDDEELEKVIQINSNKITSSKTKTKIFQSEHKAEIRNKDSINRNKNGNENDAQGNVDDGDGDGDGDDNRNISGTDGDLMAPIRALLAAQKNKEKAAFERSEAAATASTGNILFLFISILNIKF